MRLGKYDGAVDMNTQSGAGEYNVSAVVQGQGGTHLPSRSIAYIDIAMIDPDLRQFRKVFEGIEELAESIKQDGVLQPLVVKALGGTGRWQIVAGERRWRAAQIAGLTKIPCSILERTEKSDELAFIDNVQRASLSRLEIYQAILEFTRRGLKHRAILVMLGKTSESYVSKAVKVADFADHALSANFATFAELAQWSGGVTLNNLYEIARIADDDMSLAVTTLQEVSAGEMSSRSAGLYIDNIRTRMREPKPEPVSAPELVPEPELAANAAGEQWSFRAIKTILDDIARATTQVERARNVTIFLGDRAKNQQVVCEMIDSLMPRVQSLPQFLLQLLEKFVVPDAES